MKPYSILYWVGNGCPVCGEGCLAIIKDMKTNTFSIMCDDCDAEWREPNISEETRLPRDIEHGKIKNATLEEIKELGWDGYIQGNYVDYHCI